jgi:hypothetical protein
MGTRRLTGTGASGFGQLMSPGIPRTCRKSYSDTTASSCGEGISDGVKLSALLGPLEREIHAGNRKCGSNPTKGFLKQLK